jgi:hypothetical protein
MRNIEPKKGCFFAKIMEKFKKVVGSLLIIIFLCQHAVFAAAGRDSVLRPPSQFSLSENRILRSIYNNQWVTAEGLDGILLNKKTGRIKFTHEDKPPMIVDFVLWGVRHGETEGNKLNVFQGIGDGELNQLTIESENKAKGAAEILFA